MTPCGVEWFSAFELRIGHEERAGIAQLVALVVAMAVPSLTV